MSNVFISYERGSQPLVETLAEDIKGLGHTVWLDQELSGGQSWWDQILGNVRKCDVFVFALTPRALESVACTKEYEYAFALGKPIIPVLITDGESTNLLPEALSQIQFVDFRNPSERSAALKMGKALNAVTLPESLPDPLPLPPDVPISYMSSLSHRVAASSLTYEEQSALVLDIKASLNDPATTSDAIELLGKLRKRQDLFAKIDVEISELLKEGKREKSTWEDESDTKVIVNTNTNRKHIYSIRFTIPVGEDAAAYLGGQRDAVWGQPAATSLALSRNGNLLVYSAWERGSDEKVNSQLYVRRLDREQAHPIDGTEGASSPFFSPDDMWIGFFVARSLRRVPVTGGRAETIIREGKLDLFQGASWGDDGTIVYADINSDLKSREERIALFRVAASGGSRELLVDPESSMNHFLHYGQPQLLPGSEMLLFHALTQNFDPAEAGIIAMDLNTGTQTSLLTNAMNPHYVAETGHLLFMRQGSLMAVAFDPDKLLIKANPVLVEEDVMQALGMPNTGYETGAAQLAVSSSGHLAYARGGVFPNRPNTVVRVTHEGETEPLNSASLANFKFTHLRLSNRGDRLAFTEKVGSGSNIYVHDFVRDITQQLNTGGYYSSYPSWSPDDEFIAFSSDREDNVGNIYRMPANGSGEQPERLVPSDQDQRMMSWSSDGVIAYAQGGDIWMLPPDGEPAPFFTSEVDETYATFSPDGKWLAYGALGSRGPEVYVRPYPGPGPAVLISGNRSDSPAWSSNGKQLYLRQVNANYQKPLTSVQMMVVDIAEGIPSPAQSLIDSWPYVPSGVIRSHDVLEDGGFIAISLDDDLENSISSMFQRFELVRVNEIQVVLNFFEVLRQRVVD